MTKPIHNIANSSMIGILNAYGKETERIALSIVSFDKEVALKIAEDIKNLVRVEPKQGLLF